MKILVIVDMQNDFTSGVLGNNGESTLFNS